MSELGNLTWPDAHAIERKVLIIPLGSVEQHGPHLPLDTDSVIAQAIANEVHTRAPESGLAPLVARPQFFDSPPALTRRRLRRSPRPIAPNVA